MAAIAGSSANRHLETVYFEVNIEFSFKNQRRLTCKYRTIISANAGWSVVQFSKQFFLSRVARPERMRLWASGGAAMGTSGLNCVESCVNCHLRSRSFFCDLSAKSVEAFNKIKHAAVFPEHAVVQVEGQDPWGIFVLCQGRAKLSTTSRDGKTLIVRIAEAGEVLGLHAVVTGGPYQLTVETMQPCQLDFVGRDDMLHFIGEHTDACLHAIQHLARDCSDSYGVVRTIGLSHSVAERFARFLLETSADGEVLNGTVRVRLAMTHEEISQLVGTSRETITRLLSELRRNATAELKGSMLIIRNRPALKHMIGA
jgi:CRP/FNR family cyclic AMP-dependent transcriptional regulator